MNDILVSPFMKSLDLFLATTDDQEDQANILLWLEEIDSKFFNFKPPRSMNTESV